MIKDKSDQDLDLEVLGSFKDLAGRHIQLAMNRVPSGDLGASLVLRDKLWLGDASNGNDLGFLQANQITAVVSLGYGIKNGNCYTTFENVKYYRINIEDDQKSQIAPYFDDAANFIHNHSRVLVHCVAGVSRSASICIAYLMRHGRLSFDAAYMAVKLCRPFICPNAGFMVQLLDYENRLHRL